MNGSIAWYSTDRKYGFISGTDQQDYYFNYKFLEDKNEQFLKGDHVVFEAVRMKDGRYLAKKVKRSG